MLLPYSIMQNLHYNQGMDLYWFRDLERLKNTGNFSQAALLSSLSQPAFSRRIKALEMWMNTRLVDRTNQPVCLTDTGQQILATVLQALDHIEAERSNILAELAIPDNHVFTFSALHSIAWRFYPAWLQALEQTYEPIQSRLRADNFANSMADLIQGNVDFAIAYLDDDSKALARYLPNKKDIADLSSLVIGHDTLVPVCKPTPEGVPIYSLDQHDASLPYLRFGNNALIDLLLEPLFQAKCLANRLHAVYENAMVGALRIRAQAGDGITWLPKSLVKPDLHNGLLVYAGDASWNINLEVRIFKNNKHTNHVSRALWDFIAAQHQPVLINNDSEV